MRIPLPANDVQGLPLALVFYDLLGSSGIPGGDTEARHQIEQAVEISEGDFFELAATEAALQRVRALGFVRSAKYRIFGSDRAGHIVLAFTIELGTRDPSVKPKGVLTGDAGAFPVLYESDRTQVKLLLDGGFGVFTDFNPWFGSPETFASSPVALDPADGASASWFEASAEYSLSAITRLGNSPVWVYGAGSFLTSFSAGQDLFRADTRAMTRLEDLYGGVLLVFPRPGVSINLSAGRQNWQLYDGFLFSRFAAGANAGPYPGLYLNPRTAFQMTALSQFKWKDFRLEGFYLDPAEIDYLDSNTKYVGVNLAYNSPKGLETSVLYYQSPESDTEFATDFGPVPRKGLEVTAARLGSTKLAGVQGLELFGEYAWQTNRNVAWNARAWYVRAGYLFASPPWTPNLSYRYASFSGDDPNTRTYERFDAQLSSGLDTWVQGIIAKKVVSNSNLNSHRIRLNFAPTEVVSLTLDYFWLLADQPTSGADYAQEVDLGFSWSISRNLYFLGIAGMAFPGDALKRQAGSDLGAWSTVQASLFWSF